MTTRDGHLTIKQYKALTRLTDADVVSRYNGKPGCACGCNGNYKYAKKFQVAAGKDRGYTVDDDEVSDIAVRKALSTLQRVADSEHVNDESNRWLVSDDFEWFSLTHGNRVTTIYTTKYLRS